MVSIKVKAIKVGNSVRVAIPTDILREANVTVGDSLLIDYNYSVKKITLEKVKE